MGENTIRVVIAGDAAPLARASKQAQDELGKIGKFSGKLGGMLKGGMLAAGAMAAAGLMAGFSSALQSEDALAKLKAQAGGAKWADTAGKAAGTLYRNAYGESMNDTAQAVKDTFASGLVDDNATEDQLVSLTGKAMSLAQAFDQEVGPLAQAAGQMIKTGMARNADEAFDVMTRGFQNNANKADDFLDTITEYGTQFRKMGLSGQTATGLISQGLKAGARDGDIVADAIKEFSIRAIDGSDATAAGFDAIGLSAKDMAKKIAAGGESSRTALDDTLDKLRAIKDPVKRSAAAVQLFGTQAEDLGDALFALDPDKAAQGLGKVAGAAGEVDSILGGTTSATLTSFSRTLKANLVDGINKALPYVVDGFNKIKTVVMPILKRFGDWFKTEVVPVIVPILKNLGNWFTTVGVPTLKRFADQWVKNLKPAVDQAWQSFKRDLLPALQSVFGKLRASWPTIEKVGMIFLKVVGVIMQKVVPVLIKFYAKYLATLIRFFGNVISIVLKVVKWILDFGTKLVNAGKKAWDFTKDVGSAFKAAYDAVRDAIGKAVDFVKEFPGRIKNAVGDLAGLLIDVGRDVVGGFIKGMVDKADLGIPEAVGGIKNKVVGGFNSVFRRNSPAKVMIPIGADVTAGFAVGMVKSAPAQIGGAAKRIAAKTKTALAEVAPKKASFNVGRDMGLDIARGMEKQAKKIEKAAEKMTGRAAEKMQKKAEKLRTKAQAIRDAITSVIDKVKERVGEAKDFAAGIRDQFKSFASIGGFQLQGDEVGPAKSILQQITEKATQAKQFVKGMSKLRGLGLNETTLKELQESGPDSLPQIQALLAQQSDIPAINKAVRSINKSGKSFATTETRREFGLSPNSKVKVKETEKRVVIDVTGAESEFKRWFKKIVREEGGGNVQKAFGAA